MQRPQQRRQKPEAVSGARALALDVLVAWARGDGFIDELLHRALAGSVLATRDRHFAQEVAYGVVRSLRRLDFLIDALASGDLDATTRNVLRLGLFQLLDTRVAQHAAVHESVALAGRAGSLVNAVLRRFLRERDNVMAALDAQTSAVRNSHPDFLAERWQAAFGTANTQFLFDWNNSPPPLTLRINRLAADAETTLRKADGVRVFDESGQRFPGMLEADALDTAWVEAGLCYVQDPSTITACRMLAPRPGERVLDACAAPGGKTSLLAEMMENSGDLIAADSNAQRLRQLGQNLGRLHVANVRFTLIDWLRMDAATPTALGLLREKPFDRILVDAPCSNTGVLRRRVDARWRLKPEDFSRMPRIQKAIVDALVSLLAPGGHLVYSTCSLEAEENEHVVEAILSRHSHLTLANTMTLRPWTDHVDGAFCALLAAGT